MVAEQLDYSIFWKVIFPGGISTAALPEEKGNLLSFQKPFSVNPWRNVYNSVLFWSELFLCGLTFFKNCQQSPTEH